MNPQLRQIALWEFLRWYKTKDQVVVIVFGVVGALLVWAAGRIFGEDDDPVHLAVVNAEALELESTGRFVLVPHEGAAENGLLAEPTTDDRAGVLVLEEPARARLLVAKEGAWVDELRTVLEDARLRTVLERMQLPEDSRAALFTPLSLEVVTGDGTGADVREGTIWSALAVLGLAVLGVFVGMTYQFVAITGEKQARVTELMLSAVPPQTWMDGKIAGLSLLSLASTLTYTVSGLVFLGLGRLLKSGPQLPLEFAYSLDLLWVVGLAGGGFLLWNTLFAAVAATVNDPYSSARGSLLMLPLVPLGLALLALARPDELWTRVCAVLPPTSWAVMPVRLLLEDPPWWELGLAFVLLAAAIHALRTAAGRIFHLAILLYGKEPSWREMWRWSRRP